MECLDPGITSNSVRCLLAPLSSFRADTLAIPMNYAAAAANKSSHEYALQQLIDALRGVRDAPDDAPSGRRAFTDRLRTFLQAVEAGKDVLSGFAKDLPAAKHIIDSLVLLSKSADDFIKEFDALHNNYEQMKRLASESAQKIEWMTKVDKFYRVYGDWALRFHRFVAIGLNETWATLSEKLAHEKDKYDDPWTDGASHKSLLSYLESLRISKEDWNESVLFSEDRNTASHDPEWRELKTKKEKCDKVLRDVQYLEGGNVLDEFREKVSMLKTVVLSVGKHYNFIA